MRNVCQSQSRKETERKGYHGYTVNNPLIQAYLFFFPLYSQASIGITIIFNSVTSPITKKVHKRSNNLFPLWDKVLPLNRKRGYDTCLC